MSTLKEITPLEAQGLTEADYKAVETLLRELRRQQGLSNNVVTWKNAFTVFKMLHRQFALPAPKYERYAFLAVVSDLKATGYGLLALMGEQAGEICGSAGMTVDAFEACLEYLELAEKAVALERDTETLGKLDAFFAVA